MKKARENSSPDTESIHLQELVVQRGNQLVEKDKTIVNLKDEIEGWRGRFMGIVKQLHDKIAEQETDQTVIELTAAVSKLKTQVEQERLANNALKSVMIKVVERERKESELLRSAKSISELLNIQNVVQ